MMLICFESNILIDFWPHFMHRNSMYIAFLFCLALDIGLFYQLITNKWIVFNTCSNKDCVNKNLTNLHCFWWWRTFVVFVWLLSCLVNSLNKNLENWFFLSTFGLFSLELTEKRSKSLVLIVWTKGTNSIFTIACFCVLREFYWRHFCLEN